MCKQRVGNAWRFVGRTDGLLGNRPRLYHNDRAFEDPVFALEGLT